MTAIPCGQKKSSREMIQSQTVTLPLAAMLGTTFKLKTATTNSNTKSERPSTRLRWGWLSPVVDKTTPRADDRCRASLGWTAEDGCPYVVLAGRRNVRPTLNRRDAGPA